MKLRARIMWQFLWRLILVMILVMGVYTGTIIFLFNDVTKLFENPEQDLSQPRNMLLHLQYHTQIRDKDVLVPKETLQEIKKQHGWLQILDGQGEEIFQFERPTSIPTQYTPGELLDYRKGYIKTGYEMYTWFDFRKGQAYTWIYGLPRKDELLLQKIQKQTVVEQGKTVVPSSLLQQLSSYKGWLQILDEKGNELFRYHAPEKQPHHYAPGELAYHEEYASTIIYAIDVKNQQKLTWILGTGKIMNEKLARNMYQEREKVIFLSAMISGILITVVIAFLFGQHLGVPVLHMMNWLQQIAKGSYDEPLNKVGRPRSLHPRSGKLRRSFRTYREVFEALQRLTQILKQNEENRQRLEKSREEWIAGISHDLKTPLSSVKGYADLLLEEQYHWSEQEMRNYVKVIQEKALYMEQLIEDLNLTLRLKNDALPLQRKRVNLVEVVRRSVIDLANDPRAADQTLSFHTSDEHIFFAMDPKWFQRALINLLTNASIHNPSGTHIEVAVHRDPKTKEIDIIIQDNGIGMDEETMFRLFDRYYRGTNTQHQGTGTGLGMAIAHQLIQVHQGKIWIESKLGKGTKITIQLDEASENEGSEKRNLSPQPHCGRWGEFNIC